MPADHLIGERRGARARLLLPDGGLRERPAADRGAGRRGDAGRLRSGPRLRPQPHGVRVEHRRLPADQGQARPDGGADPGRPPVRLPRRHADGQGAGHDGGEHGQGLRLQGRRVGDPGGDADPRRVRLRRGVRRQPAVRRRPRAVDLRGRRRDAVPQGDRPPPRSPDSERVGPPSAGAGARRHSDGPTLGGQTRSASDRMRSKSASGWSSYGSSRIGCRPAAVAPTTSIVTESPT